MGIESLKMKTLCLFHYATNVYNGTVREFPFLNTPFPKLSVDLLLGLVEHFF